MQATMLKTLYGTICSLTVFTASVPVTWAATDQVGGQPTTGRAIAWQDAAPAGNQLRVQADVPSIAPTEGGAKLDFGPAADLGKLGRSRGGTDTHNETNLSGIVTNNSAVNVVTGNNVIDAGSFANMSGIPVVIQNSGANVLIQNSTVVNLQMK